MPRMPKVTEAREPNKGGGLPFFNPYKGAEVKKPRAKTKTAKSPKSGFKPYK